MSSATSSACSTSAAAPGVASNSCSRRRRRPSSTGVDIDTSAIDWASKNLPFAHLWLAELQRIVRPGGVLLHTVHGGRMAMGVLKQLADSGEDPEPYQRALSQDAILFFEDDTFVGSVHPPFYDSTFHAPWYVFSHWGKSFTIRAYIPGGSWDQDLVVLERPAGVGAAITPIEPARSTPAPAVASAQAPARDPLGAIETPPPDAPARDEPEPIDARAPDEPLNDLRRYVYSLESQLAAVRASKSWRWTQRNAPSRRPLQRLSGADC